MTDKEKRKAEVTQAASTTQSVEGTTKPSKGRDAIPYESLIQNELKIKGQTGEEGQKDNLSFSSLIHQIDRGLARGYGEEEVVDTIINAMVPGLTLRSYLEEKPDLELPVLRRLLRSHYR